MININLLPWRQLKRAQEKKVFTLFSLALLMGTISFVFLMDYYAHGLVDKQLQINHQLQKDIAIRDRQLKEITTLEDKKKALLSKMEVLKNLQAPPIVTVHLFDELVNIMPAGVYLIQLARTGNKITLVGYSKANKQIALLMRRIDRDPWIQNPTLTEIKKSSITESLEGNEFKLNFILKSSVDVVAV